MQIVDNLMFLSREWRLSMLMHSFLFQLDHERIVLCNFFFFFSFRKRNIRFEVRLDVEFFFFFFLEI